MPRSLSDFPLYPPIQRFNASPLQALVEQGDPIEIEILRDGGIFPSAVDTGRPRNLFPDDPFISSDQQARLLNEALDMIYQDVLRNKIIFVLLQRRFEEQHRDFNKKLLRVAITDSDGRFVYIGIKALLDGPLADLTEADGVEFRTDGVNTVDSEGKPAFISIKRLVQLRAIQIERFIREQDIQREENVQELGERQREVEGQLDDISRLIPSRQDYSDAIFSAASQSRGSLMRYGDSEGFSPFQQQEIDEYADQLAAAISLWDTVSESLDAVNRREGLTLGNLSFGEDFYLRNNPLNEIEGAGPMFIPIPPRTVSAEQATAILAPYENDISNAIMDINNYEASLATTATSGWAGWTVPLPNIDISIPNIETGA